MIIEGYVYPDERTAFYHGGTSIIVYSFKSFGKVRFKYTKDNNIDIKDMGQYQVIIRKNKR